MPADAGSMITAQLSDTAAPVSWSEAISRIAEARFVKAPICTQYEATGRSGELATDGLPLSFAGRVAGLEAPAGTFGRVGEAATPASARGGALEMLTSVFGPGATVTLRVSACGRELDVLVPICDPVTLVRVGRCTSGRAAAVGAAPCGCDEAVTALVGVSERANAPGMSTCAGGLDIEDGPPLGVPEDGGLGLLLSARGGGAGTMSGRDAAVGTPVSVCARFDAEGVMEAAGSTGVSRAVDGAGCADSSGRSAAARTGSASSDSGAWRSASGTAATSDGDVFSCICLKSSWYEEFCSTRAN